MRESKAVAHGNPESPNGRRIMAKRRIHRIHRTRRPIGALIKRHELRWHGQCGEENHFRTFHFPHRNFTFTFYAMTEAQQQMIDKAFEMLSEHFDHVVIAVGTYDEDKQYTTTASYYGGVAPAIGLCKLYEKRWTKEHLWGPDEED
jgi:hypothetical protein